MAIRIIGCMSTRLSLSCRKIKDNFCKIRIRLNLLKIIIRKQYLSIQIINTGNHQHLTKVQLKINMVTFHNSQNHWFQHNRTNLKTNTKKKITKLTNWVSKKNLKTTTDRTKGSSVIQPLQILTKISKKSNLNLKTKNKLKKRSRKKEKRCNKKLK